MFFQTSAALALGRRLKEAAPAIKLVYGGASFHDEMGGRTERAAGDRAMSELAYPLDPLLAERERLGAVERITFAAPSLVEAHRLLGERLQGPASASIRARLAATREPDLERQLRDVRASRAFLESRAADVRLAGIVRGAIAEYLECLDTWSRAVRADAWLPEPRALDGGRIAGEELALWAQDDNVGCQTGMLRQRDGSVLVWHTEEDQLGYLDRPRVATFVTADATRSAFLYPYLLPGPAFGHGADQLHAVDSLVLKRGLAARGAFTSAASFVVWRLGAAVEVRPILQALAPYLDGCAINVVRPTRRGVLVEIHEIGGRHVQTRRLGTGAGAFCVQANAVLRHRSPLARHELLTPQERAPYDHRIARVSAALRRGLGAPGEPASRDILRLLASRRGGRHAFANATVKGHLVARVSTRGLAVHVGAGAARPDDVLTLER